MEVVFISLIFENRKFNGNQMGQEKKSNNKQIRIKITMSYLKDPQTKKWFQAKKAKTNKVKYLCKENPNY